jgi:hypothetical protein
MEGRFRVAALAGRRVDAADTSPPRFPLERVSTVRSALRALFSSAGVADLVSSAACGADLTALQAALAPPPLRRHVVLPFEAERFLRTSVIDRPGPWQAVFAQVLADAATEVNDLACSGDNDEAYSQANERILQWALELAAGTQPLAIVVWNRHVRRDGDATADFRARAAELGFAIRDVNPLGG